MACAIRRPRPRGTACRLCGHRSLAVRVGAFFFLSPLLPLSPSRRRSRLLPWPQRRCHPWHPAASCRRRPWRRQVLVTAAKPTRTQTPVLLPTASPRGTPPTAFRRDRKAGMVLYAVCRGGQLRCEDRSPSTLRLPFHVTESRIPSLTPRSPPDPAQPPNPESDPALCGHRGLRVLIATLSGVSYLQPPVSSLPPHSPLPWPQRRCHPWHPAASCRRRPWRRQVLVAAATPTRTRTAALLPTTSPRWTPPSAFRRDRLAGPVHNPIRRGGQLRCQDLSLPRLKTIRQVSGVDPIRRPHPPSSLASVRFHGHTVGAIHGTPRHHGGAVHGAAGFLLPPPNRSAPKGPLYFQPRPPVGHRQQSSAATAKRGRYPTRFVAAGSYAATTQTHPTH